MKTFADLQFPEPIVKALARLNFETPTEIQSQAIPLILEGKDVLATAQTGTGKTAAFALPILAKMLESAEKGEKPKRALIIAPTRELAEQIGVAIRDFTFFTRRLRYTVIIGGSPYSRQLRELSDGPFFVVGTPGRLIDHLGSGALELDTFGHLVLDEADRMLDMGFEPQIEEIVKSMPAIRQTSMFSATLPPEVRKLVSRYMKDPSRIAIGEENRPVDRIKQDMIELSDSEKEKTLLSEVAKAEGSIIVFTKTKIRADRVARTLNEAGVHSDALHGDLTQGARRRVTQDFRDGKIRILVATDIAARGLDINHIRHVINFDLPMVPEDYIHRIGRTARAGLDGHSIAFVTSKERPMWYRILKLMGLPTPKPGPGGVSRDRGGRRNDGKFGRGPAGQLTPTFRRGIAGSDAARTERAHESRPSTRRTLEDVAAVTPRARPSREERFERLTKPAERETRPPRAPRAPGAHLGESAARERVAAKRPKEENYGRPWTAEKPKSVPPTPQPFARPVGATAADTRPPGKGGPKKFATRGSKAPGTGGGFAVGAGKKKAKVSRRSATR